MSEWKGLVFLSHNTSFSGGVALCFHKTFFFSMVHIEVVDMQELESMEIQGHIKAIKKTNILELSTMNCGHRSTHALNRD